MLLYGVESGTVSIQIKRRLETTWFYRLMVRTTWMEHVCNKENGNKKGHIESETVEISKLHKERRVKKK